MQLYTCTLELCACTHCLQVETIGDAYMVAAGLLETSTDHAVAITNMAFALREEAGNVMDPVDNEPIKVSS